MNPHGTKEAQKSRSWRNLRTNAKAKFKDLFHGRSSETLIVAGTSDLSSPVIPSSSVGAQDTDTAPQAIPDLLIADSPSSTEPPGITPPAILISDSTPADDGNDSVQDDESETVEKPLLWLAAYHAAAPETKAWIERIPDINLSQGMDKGDQVWAQELVELVRSLEQKHHDGISQIHIGRKRVSPRDFVPATIDLLTTIGDVAIQFAPNPSGIVWSAVKVLLKLPVTGLEQTTAVLAYTARIVNILSRGKVYEGVFTDKNTSPESLQTLHRGLIALYAKSLDLLAYAARHLKNDFRQMLGWITDPGHAESLLAELIQCEADVAWAAESCDVTRSANVDVRHTELLLSLRESLQQVDDEMLCLFDKMDAQEMLDALDYFSDVKFGEQHQKKAEARTPGTGQWLLSHDKFKKWYKTEESAILWLHGTVGTGKSFLASTVIDLFLRVDNAAGTQLSATYSDEASECSDWGTETASDKESELWAETDQGFAYFYCERGSTDLSEPISVLRSFVRQLSTVPCYPDFMQKKFVQLYYTKRKQGAKLSMKDCQDQLLVSANLYPKTVLVLDGLDECNPDERSKLVETLSRLVTDAKNPVKLFISSRREQDIATHLETHAVVEINASDNWHDIQKFVQQRIGEIEKTGRWNSISQSLRDKVERTVCEKSEGMFRWAYMQMDQLSKILQERQLEARLGKLPKSLNDAYDELFQRIQDEDRETLERAVKWVMCVRSPLTTNEILGAVRLSIGSNGTSLILNPMIFEETLLEICSHLIVKDSKSSKWRFPHASVIEYFEGVHQWDLEQAHLFVTKICLLCLLDDNLLSWPVSDDGSGKNSDSSASDDGDEQDNEDDNEQDNERDSEHDDKYLYSGADIDSYVLMGWLFHVGALEQLQTSNGEISRLLSQFLGVDRSPQQSSRHFQRWLQLVYGQWLPTDYVKGYTNFQPDENPIFFICAMGLYHTLRDYWASEVDVSPVNESQRDVLSMAVYHGHLNICKGLIAHGFDMNKQNDGHPSDYSALSTAVLERRTDIVRFLINQGADPNLPLNKMSPLCASIGYRGSSMECVRLLLEAKADPNHPCGPLCRYSYALEKAVYEEEIEVVRLLLESGANPNLLGEVGHYGSALAVAARTGNEELCRFLLGRGADVNASLRCGIYGSALAAAAHGCHRHICQLLIERGADINQPLTGGSYGSAFAAALASRSRGIFKMIRYLVEDVHADTSILSTSPPLRMASCRKTRNRKQGMKVFEYLTEGRHVREEVLMEIGFKERHVMSRPAETGSVSLEFASSGDTSCFSYSDYTSNTATSSESNSD
ncbi:hypothetical protein V8C44DRAFT_343832 [Trichoderma aethiopicum]